MVTTSATAVTTTAGAAAATVPTAATTGPAPGITGANQTHHPQGQRENNPTVAVTRANVEGRGAMRRIHGYP